MIGKMNHRVTLQSSQVTIGDGGRKTTVYADIATVWAAIEPQVLDGVITADHIEFPVFFTITCHFSKDYLDARRIRYGSRTFTVKSALNLSENNSHIVFRTEED